MNKKLTALMLAAALILTTAGCAQNDGTVPQATADTTASETAPETTAAPEETSAFETTAPETSSDTDKTEKTTAEITTESPDETTTEITSDDATEAAPPSTTAALETKPETTAATFATTAAAMPVPAPAAEAGEAYDYGDDDDMGYYEEPMYESEYFAADGLVLDSIRDDSPMDAGMAESAECIDDWYDDYVPPVYPEVQARAGLLTAGEWRDNSNYVFWKSLFGQRDDWKDIMENWGVSTMRRVFVRVTDSNGKPASGLTVKLMSGSSELWQAVTDSRGEAFLFAGLSLSGGSTPDKVVVESAGGSVSAKVSADYTDSDRAIAVEVSKEAAMRKKLDLMFMVDTTGSMGDELRYLQKELEDVIKRVNEATQADIRLSVNFYRDEGDDYVVRDFAFTDNIETALKQLAEQSSDGGGDYPEAVIKALDNAVSGHTWRDDSEKLMFLVLDAPPHFDDGKQNYARLVKAFASKGIRVIPVASSGVDTDTEYLLRTIALATGGTYTFLTNDSGIGGSHLEPTIGKYEVEKLNDLLVRIISDYFSRETRKTAEAPKPQQPTSPSIPEGAYKAEWCKTSDYYSGEGFYETKYIYGHEGLMRFFNDYGKIEKLIDYVQGFDFEKNVLAVDVVMLSSGSISVDTSKPVYCTAEGGKAVFTCTLDRPEVGTDDMAALFFYAAIPAKQIDIPFTDKQLNNMQTVDNEIGQKMAEIKNKSFDEKKKVIGELLEELADKGLIYKDSIYFGSDMYSFTYDLGDYSSVAGGVKLNDFDPLTN